MIYGGNLAMGILWNPCNTKFQESSNSKIYGEILLFGINYDDDKGHTCEIERVVKD